MSWCLRDDRMKRVGQTDRRVITSPAFMFPDSESVTCSFKVFFDIFGNACQLYAGIVKEYYEALLYSRYYSCEVKQNKSRKLERFLSYPRTANVVTPFFHGARSNHFEKTVRKCLRNGHLRHFHTHPNYML